MTYTIVGVIGHIDHGKTSLVAALTGIDTDTHPEEKQRGITIDLGFASFTECEHQFALIDAPGHQKYVGNLLAGVASIDVGLLVVACDQGIQQQTLEHASILQMLGVRRLIVALSRIDLATQEAKLELQEELELFLDDFGFDDVPMIPISAPNGVGIDELKTQLCRTAEENETRAVGSYFRMPVDRVFSMPGRGCVVAGTVWSGAVNVGDRLILGASAHEVRIREIEVHGESVETSRVGFRTALNVTGVSASEVQRGDELIQADVFEPSNHLLMEIQTFKGAPEVKCPATLQLHIAAAACTARITGVRRLLPSQSAVVVVETDVPVVASFGQKCLLRLPYPVGTVGGATVLATIDGETKRTRKLIELGEKIAMSDPVERLLAWTEFRGELEPSSVWCELQLGIPKAAQSETICAAIENKKVSCLPGSDRLVSDSAVERVGRFVTEALRRRAEESSNAWCVVESLMQQGKSFGSAELIRLAVKSLVKEGRIVQLGNTLAIASDTNSLSKKQLGRMEKIAALFVDNRSPPTTKEIAATLQLPIDSVTSLSKFAVQTGILHDVGEGFLLSADTFGTLCTELQQMFAENAEQTVSEIRDRWNVTRKHAIPFLEFCDRMNVTTRKENVRLPGPQLQAYAAIDGQIT